MARRNHLPPSAVEDAIDAGDRLDRLERARQDPGAVKSSTVGGTSWLTWSTELASGVPETRGKVTIPAGASKLTVSAGFQAPDGSSVIGNQIYLDGLDGDAGFGGGTGSGAFYLAVGVVIVKRTTVVTVRVQATTDTGDPIFPARGCVIVEPLPSSI